MRRMATALVLLLATAPVYAQVDLDHVGIQATDLARSADFYANILGLTELPAPFPKDAARWFRLGRGQLHIVGGGRAGDHNKWDHFALACADLPAMIARLDRLHVAWTDMSGARATQRRPDGINQIFVVDPDGYHIELNDAAGR